MNIILPENVKSIINELNEAGYEAYAVGGCVRDSFLGREPEDWDITTSAKPKQVKQIFSRTIDTGIQHGTVTVMIGKTGYEVTTYRVDGEYEDGRHPKEVSFTVDLREDLMRRDFTINAMAYNEKDGLADCFNGIADLEKKVIRCVGDACERFQEDALRMLRAVRFSAQLNFAIDKDTMTAIKVLRRNLEKVSEERIQIELLKLLLSGHVNRWQTIWDTEMIHEVMPELEAVGDQISAADTITALEASPPEKIVRLTILLYSLGERGAAAALRRLRFDNDTMTKVSRLAGWVDKHITADPYEIRKCVSVLGHELFVNLLEVKDALAAVRAEQGLEAVRSCYEEIRMRKDPCSMKELKVSGKDLMELGILPGKSMGAVLNQLLEVVLRDPQMNERCNLLEYVKREIC